MSIVLFSICFVIPGIVTILAPFFEALILALVWLNDLDVIRISTSCLSISFAIPSGGSVPLTLGICMVANFAFFAILAAWKKNSLAKSYNSESVTMNMLSFLFKPRHFFKTTLMDLIISFG